MDSGSDIPQIEADVTFTSFSKYLSDINKQYERIREEQRLKNEALKAEAETEPTDDEDDEDDENDDNDEENDEVDLISSHLSKTHLQEDSGFVGDNKSLNNKENDIKQCNIILPEAEQKVKTIFIPKPSQEIKKNEEITQIKTNHPTNNKNQCLESLPEQTSSKPRKIAQVQANKKLFYPESKSTPLEQKIQVKTTANQFITPSRPLPPSKVAQSLPTKQSNSNTAVDSSQKPRIMCTISRRHLNTPMFQIPTKKSARKHLLSTSTLASVLEDSDAVKTEKPKALSEQKVKDVFKCITVKEVEYIVLNQLGKGGSSVVYHCYDPRSREECAVKVVDLKQDKNEALGFINEVEALRRLQDCDRIIKLYKYEIVNDDKRLYMVLEKGGRDFAQILREHSRNSAHLPAFMVHFYWMQMLHAVRQMHAKGVIHSDLKPANFIEIRERLKLIDFGISSFVQLDMTSVMKTVALGTFGYISPEALCADRGGGASGQPAYKVGFKSDVWSLGCILYQLVYKRTPFAHIQHSSAQLAAIMDPHHVINYPPADWVPEGVIRCIKACLLYNAKKRPSVEELILEEHETL